MEWVALIFAFGTWIKFTTAMSHYEEARQRARRLRRIRARKGGT